MFEALLITVLGTYKNAAQNRMNFAVAREWTQVTIGDYSPRDGVCRRVAEEGFADREEFRVWEE